MSSSPDMFEFGQLEEPRGVAVLEPHNAEEQLAAMAAEAASRGYDEGLRSGLAEAQDRVAGALGALASAADQMRDLTDTFASEAERGAVDLALELAHKVVGAAVDVNPELVLEVVRGALRRTTMRDKLVLEVNPADLELVRDAAQPLASQLGGIRHMEVIAERRVARGGCLVRTEEGEIDARIDEQLDRARELIADAMRAEPSRA